MSFLAYFAALVVAVVSVAFGLDLVTSPLPDAKPRAQVARTAPKAVRTIPLGQSTADADADKHADDRALSPVYPANPAAARGLPGATTAGAAPATAIPENVATVQAPAMDAQASVQPQPAEQAALSAPVAASAPNSCDVQACARMYKSFRASDCTYQPFDGERRLCAASSGQQDRIASPMPERRFDTDARQRKAAELRDVERRVRQLTARDIDDDDDAAVTYGRPVAIDMRDREAPGFYSRRWRTWP